jgi:hypothetical protein
MSEAKHTPGPWFVNESEDKYDQARNWRQIVTVKNKPGNIEVVPVIKWEFLSDKDGVYGDNAITKADAHLIAAAPDMLDALEAAQRFIQNGIKYGYINMPDNNCGDSALETPAKIEKAIQKARGQG